MTTHTSTRRIAATLAVCAGIALSTTASAQPSDSQVKKDLTKSGVKSIKFTNKAGTKQLDADNGTWEYVRGVEITREYAEVKGVDLLVIGDAVYQQHGSKYKYWKFRVIENRYTGIPNPSEEDIMKLVRADLRTLVGGARYNKIVGDIASVRLADEPGWEWNKPTRVTFRLVASYDIIVSYTEVESVDQEFTIILDRDEYTSPWTSFMSTAGAKTSSGKTKHSSKEVDAMETLGYLADERKAQAAYDALPTVAAPEFDSAASLALFTHKLLRNGDAGTLEAFLIQVLSPNHFVAGSSVQLNQKGADAINNAAAAAYQKKATYALEYCENAGLDKERSTDKRFYLLGAINKVNTVIAMDQYGGKYVDGVKTGKQWKIYELSVGVRQDDDAIEFINSFSDRNKLCPKD